MTALRAPSVALAISFVLGLSAGTRNIYAQSNAEKGPLEPVSHARDEARALAEHALAVLDSDPATAANLLEHAEAKFHAPTHLLYLAQARVALGQRVAAARTYQLLLEEELPDYASDAFREAQRIGRDELDALLPKLARIRLFVNRPLEEVSIRVDGVEVKAPYGVIPVEPGPHRIHVDARGAHADQSTEVRLGEEAPLRFELTLPTTDDGGPSGLAIGGIVSLSLAGALGIAGTVTGVLAIKNIDQLDDRCPKKVHCAPADQPLADDARAFGNASTGTFIAGGVAAATGIVLLIVDAASSNATPLGASLRPVAGPTFFGVQGTF